MSSRKDVENHNMFEDNEFQKQPRNKKELDEDYASNEDMTIPKFHNRVARDSGWSQRTDTR